MGEGALPPGRPSEGFRREDRVRRRRDFEALRSGRRLETKHFIVLMEPNRLGRPRLAVTASTRVGGAVGRNRVKRLVRDFFRRRKAVLPPSSDLHVIARRGSPLLAQPDVDGELKGAFARVRRGGPER